jgi:hypothetical protein
VKPHGAISWQTPHEISGSASGLCCQMHAAFHFSNVS